jgi:NAD(P)-dependent dehydrogenase (short-subunit alcohol dehydrogenase family)
MARRVLTPGHMSLLQTKVVVVGGSSGVGLAVAKAAAAAGATVVIASRSAEKVERARQAALPLALEGRTLDVADEAAVQRFFAETGPFDHLVTTPVIFTSRAGLAEQATAEFRTLFDIKFWGQYYAARYAAPFLRPGGSITLSSGQLSHRPVRGSVPRASVNGAVEALGRALAIELAPVRVNTVCAGVIATERWNDIEAGERAASFARIARALPVGRIAVPEDVAHTYLYAMTNRFTTGTTILVEGGAVLV